jgi:cytochrome c biogenesis protein CcdA
MTDYHVALGSALVLGAMTTLHPCPLAVNAAAVSLLAGWSGERRSASRRIAAFVVGYCLTFATLALLLAGTSLRLPVVASALTRATAVFLGPLLVVVGMVHADVLPWPGSNRGNRRLLDRRARTLGGYGLGAVLALSFCPATAALFFGLLLPLAVQYRAPVAFAAAYAIGAALPLVAVAGVAARGTTALGLDRWAHRLPWVIGWLAIIAGIAISVRDVYLR